VTVAEAGKALKVDPTSLYRVVRRLEERGEIRKNGRQLEAVGSDA
jgi:DNA-binding MarR family transcriptional regulator